jgi:hypothetical protein
MRANVPLLLLTAEAALVLVTTRTRGGLLARVRLVHTIRVRLDRLPEDVIAYGAHVAIRLTCCLATFGHRSRRAHFAGHVLQLGFHEHVVRLDLRECIGFHHLDQTLDYLIVVIVLVVGFLVVAWRRPVVAHSWK